MSKQEIKESVLVTSEDMADSREEFRKYFVGLKRKLNLGSELENVLWLHLKAIGMDKKEQFDDGIRHFGYRMD